ncbi:hypothetical protein SAMN06264364_10352 [Quadrisphaera granulorum]|uniref:Uncharacterized protein n=1 Tax=Quadrisphaera granulorum TaxID=317664 RepID=A0A316ACS3_9ACTN|nr:hypothetical protein [Quadrisphaera granulorum]PWJ55382.1 hypothetical protein BXY45_10352 [Quadrisphaera granulorum]SZE95446.1 hypothetical protein SAMN06264364_10352 [Quadrisphaera granulorum]
MNTTATSAAVASTATAPRRGLRARLVRAGAVATLLTLPLGVGGVALAGAASAAQAKTVHTSDGRAIDALGGKHFDGFGEDGSYDQHAQAVWSAAGERFTETKHNGCNPYTYVTSVKKADPKCPGAQAKNDWNKDFLRFALANSGFKTWYMDDSDLESYKDMGVVTSLAEDPDYVPEIGDVIVWTNGDDSRFTVGIVLEARSASKVKVTVGDLNDKVTTKWINPATFTIKGQPVEGYISLDTP